MSWISLLFGLAFFLAMIAIFVAAAMVLGLDEALGDNGGDE